MSNIEQVSILYEDLNIIAINKPAGLMVHADGRSSGPFLTDWVLKHFPDAKNVGEPIHGADGSHISRPGIVHRLDRETSGVLLVAKTALGHSHLKKQFQERTIKKKYLAYIWGELKEKFGTISKPIGRDANNFRKWSASRGARGEMREAETYWEKLKDIEVESVGPKDASEERSFTLVEVEPKTGRTHQIRVHFAAIQHPVVGDNLYATKRPMALGFSRTALHAKSIEFENCEGKRVCIKAPEPEDFLRAGKI